MMQVRDGERREMEGREGQVRRARGTRRMEGKMIGGPTSRGPSAVSPTNKSSKEDRIMAGGGLMGGTKKGTIGGKNGGTATIQWPENCVLGWLRGPVRYSSSLDVGLGPPSSCDRAPI